MKVVLSSSFANFLAALAAIFAVAGAVGWYLIETRNELLLTQVRLGGEPFAPVATTTPTAGGELPSSWKSYRSDRYEYEFHYPAEWRATGDAEYLVFRETGNRELEYSPLTFDLGCAFATGFEDADSVRTEQTDRALGPNRFSDRKTFVTSGGKETLAVRALTTAYPEWYRRGNDFAFLDRCAGPAFIVGASTTDEALSKILASFRFVEPEKMFCGGIAGIICPVGYSCELDGSYPDAGGTCVPLPERKPDAAPSTEGWQTYRNEEYGFEVRYPGGWTVATSDIQQYFEKPTVRISSPENAAMSLFVAGPRGIETDEQGNEVISETIDYSLPSVSSSLTYSAVKILKSQDNRYWLAAGIPAVSLSLTIRTSEVDSLGGLNVFKEILSTFRFTE